MINRILAMALALIACGCVSEEEAARRQKIVEKIIIERSEEINNPNLSDDVIMGNVQFYTDWLIDLKKRGYPVTDNDIEELKCGK
jgi:hypothetical protein